MLVKLLQSIMELVWSWCLGEPCLASTHLDLEDVNFSWKKVPMVEQEAAQDMDKEHEIVQDIEGEQTDQNLQQEVQLDQFTWRDGEDLFRYLIHVIFTVTGFQFDYDTKSPKQFSYGCNLFIYWS